jgi:hypothetical protein
MMRRFGFLALIMPLSGCWSGDSFYAASEGVAAIPAGKYRVYNTYDPTATRIDIERQDREFAERLTISYGDDNRAIVEGLEGGESNNSTLVKLGDQPGLYVVQADFGASIQKIGSSIYALVNLTPNGYLLAVPKCDQKRAKFYDRAIVSGLLVGKPVCKFNTRGELETAMLDYAKDPISWTEYRRVKKRQK